MGTRSLQLFFIIFVIYVICQTIFKMAFASKQGKNNKASHKTVLKWEKEFNLINFFW